MSTGFQRVCPRCERLCPPSAIFCVGCGGALVTAEAVAEGLARIRAEAERQVEATSRLRASNGRRTGGNATKGKTARRCSYCGRRCFGETCAGCRDLAEAERL